MTIAITLQPWLTIPAILTAIVIWLAAHDDNRDLWPTWIVLWVCTAGISLATGIWAQWGAP